MTFSLPPSFRRPARHALFVLLFYSILFTIFFAPVLFTGSLLAPGGGRLGDGLLSHLTFFQSPKLFWDTLLASGFPMIADSQAMSFYPPSLLLSQLPGAWNAFVVSAFVLASCFTYGYVFALTESRLAGLLSGTIYGMCGFMLAHLGHTAIIHSAAWLPLIVWSLEMLRRKFSRGWFVVGCLAVFCCVLAGHLQIVAYSLLLSACYAAVMGWNAADGRARYYAASALLLLIGVGLAALQLFPTRELVNLSARTEYGFSDFVSYSLPLKQIVMLFFPAVFGGLAHYGTVPYFGEWNLTELTGYVGLLPLVLAAVGFAASRRKTVALFWLCAGIIAFILALGDQTPLAYLTYRLPVIGKFRAPARHFIEMAFATSVLAGFGIRAIRLKMVTTRQLLKVVLVGTVVMLAGLLFLISKHSTEYLVEGGVARLNALPWANAAVWTPLAVFLVAGLVLLYWQRAPASSLRKTLLMVVLVVDIGSFGWFYSWHDYSPEKTIANPPSVASRYSSALLETNQRMIPVRGTLGGVDELPPNLSRLWGVPSASGYSPLSLLRMTYLLSMRQDASLDPSWKNADDQSLNLAAVRYVFLPRIEHAHDVRGVSWSQESMGTWLGSGCTAPPRSSLKLDLPVNVRATAVSVVSRLACAVNIQEGTEVLRVLVTGADGSVQTRSLVAGRDTSEWTYDSPGTRPQMKHNRAAVFSSVPAKMEGAAYEAHDYVTTLNLEGVKEIRSVEFQWTGQPGAIAIEKVTLVNELTGTSEPVNPLSMQGSRWRFIEDAGEARVYENLRAMPRAWLVSEVVSLRPEEMLTAIKTSRLPDGRSFDPRRTALLEEPLVFSAQISDPAASARVIKLTERMMEVETSSSSQAFLVTSDADYPGWEATVDGASAQLFRADYAFRGVAVPAGEHLVRFNFRPKSFYYGAAISSLSLIALAALLLFPVPLRGRGETGIIKLTSKGAGE